ncbi:anthranilate synthase component I [Nodosilinea sp. PGN35]|uniref:anthranilate synthase component I n=1 Tax=Nodosilinea sp. PGN35 TaxID=3020489 RepID=UPI00351D7372
MGQSRLGRRALSDGQGWWVRSQPLGHRTGSDIFQCLYGDLLLQPPTPASLVALLESPFPLPVAAQPHAAHSRYSICAGPPRYVGALPQVWTPAVGSILPTLAERLTAAEQPRLLGDEADAAETLPFTGGWLGWLGYDLAWEIERLPTINSDPLPFPVALWYEPATFAVLDHQAQRLWLFAPAPAALDSLEKQLSLPGEADPLIALKPGDPRAVTLGMAAAEYQQAVLRAKQHIQAGDVFQVNLSLRFSTETTAHSWTLYRQLQRINPSPFACYWRTPWGDVISCSPERLVKLQHGLAQTRPIAGTRPRGATPEQDAELAQTLLSNPKERAEHIMLVDLERNDLGRVCRWGTVQVNELLTVEYYSHVMHLVSNVVGQLESLAPHQRTAIDLIRAVFPGGTITGCPKVRCMEIIEALEPVRRSLFYGSCGYLDRRGHLDLNILIRTLLVGHTESHWAPSTVWGQVGAGIVADSDPAREWQESLQKARAQLLALGLE